MNNKKKEKKINKDREPQPDCGSTGASNRIHIFHSFEEENEFVAKERAALSHNERMLHVEVLRKQVFNEHLLENGKWPTIANVFKIMPPYIHVISE